MYVLSQDRKGNTDVSSYFDDDFFNSSVIYQLPRAAEETYSMTYRTREDLVSSDAYGNSRYLGLVLLSVGSTLNKDSNGDLEVPSEFEPLKEIELIDLEGLRSSQLLTVVHNTMTTKETNPLRKPEHEYYELQSKRFKPVTPD